MYVIGTDANIDERYFFKNGGYSDQFDNITWSGAMLWKVLPK
jgi:hypothetical protein